MGQFIKSPFNYIGNKYKQLSQLEQIFPKNINNFLDLLCGGCDVSINTTANNIYANDINRYVIDIIREFQNHSIEEILDFINNRIKEFNLSKTNEQGYYNFRDLYNQGVYNTPLDLFILTRFSFNYFIRFNNKLQMNASFGAGRSCFNPIMEKNTIAFHKQVQNLHLSTLDFKLFDISNFGENDFIYADPPYTISYAPYNKEAKKAYREWDYDDDYHLFNFLDNAGKLKIKWALSNMIKHKNKINIPLEEWINDNHYTVYNIKSDYTYSSYNSKISTDPTVEVVITNY